jgi:hypothetical protein
LAFAIGFEPFPGHQGGGVGLASAFLSDRTRSFKTGAGDGERMTPKNSFESGFAFLTDEVCIKD